MRPRGEAGRGDGVGWRVAPDARSTCPRYCSQYIPREGAGAVGTVPQDVIHCEAGQVGIPMEVTAELGFEVEEEFPDRSKH